MRSTIKNTWASLLQLIGNVRWAFQLTWSTHRSLFMGIIGATLVQSLLPAALALVSRGLINSVSDVLTGQTEVTDPIIFWLILSTAVAMAGPIASNVQNYCKDLLQDQLDLRITGDMLTHAARLDFAFFEDPESRDMLQRAQRNMASQFAEFLIISLSVISNIVQIISLLIILMAIQPVILLVLAPVGLGYLVFQWHYALKRYEEDYSRATKNRWMGYYVSQLMSETNVAQVKLLGLSPLFIRQFKEVMTEFVARNRYLHRYGFIGGLVFAITSTLAVYYAFTLATFEVIAGGLTIGDVAIYGGAVMRLRGAIESTVGWMGALRWKTLFVSNLSAFLAVEPEMPQSGTSVPATNQGEIVVEDLVFTYPGAAAPTLQGVSLRINPGETVAIVGENGAGKTTLVKLLARLYDPDAGRILFDQVDVRELKPGYLHQNISFVFQQFGRYAATAADNIAYGDWTRLMDDKQQVERIAQSVAIHEMIAAMPQGYETMLGRNFGEYNLSGGQWQRLAIARAFARHPSLLILDEPTANLDAKAEFQIFADFKKLAEGRTTILISHRFSTVSIADRIIVMDQGRVAEVGSHEQLLAKNGQYATLYRLHAQQMNLAKVATNGNTHHPAVPLQP